MKFLALIFVGFLGLGGIFALDNAFDNKINEWGISKKLGTFAPPPSSSETPSTTGWTDDGSIVRLSTDSDNIGIGTRNPLAGFKVHVVGNEFVSGDLTISGGDFTLGAGSASSTLSVSSNGFLGIGTSTPSFYFSVHGSAIFAGTTTVAALIATSSVQGTRFIFTSNATNTASGGINLTGGCFSINNTCLSAGNSLAIGTT